MIPTEYECINWQLKNDDSHTNKITWRTTIHCRNSIRRIRRWKKSLNCWYYLWQYFSEILLNELTINTKDVKRIWKIPISKIPIKGYLHDLWDIRAQSKDLFHGECVNITICHYCDKPVHVDKYCCNRIREEKSGNKKKKYNNKKCNYFKMNNKEEKCCYRKKNRKNNLQTTSQKT